MLRKCLVGGAIFMTVVVLASIYLGTMADLRNHHTNSAPLSVLTNASINHWRYTQTVYSTIASSSAITTVTADVDYRSVPGEAYHYTMFVREGQVGEFRLRVDPKYNVKWFLGEVPRDVQASYYGTISETTTGEIFQVWGLRSVTPGVYTLCFTTLEISGEKSQAGPWIAYLHLCVVSP
jgi:hypothetical protein